MSVGPQVKESDVRQISLRRFRDTVADIHEPVEVSRRDPEGNIQVLGYWTPYVTHPPGSVELVSTAIVKDPLPGYEFKRVDSPEEVAQVVKPVRPFTKAEQAGRKRK